MPTAHSALVGGSTAARLLNCAASFQEALKQPPIRLTSDYAEEGTALHDAIAMLLRAGDEDGGPANLNTDLPASAQWLLGKTCNGRTISQTDIDEMIRPALQALVDICARYGGGFRAGVIEATCQYPGVPGAFGTVDLILASASYTLVVDFKFGRGLRVEALRTEADGDVVNEQLMFYVIAAKRSHPRLFQGRSIVVAIIQPAFDEGAAGTVRLSNRDITDYRRAMERAVADALAPAPVHTRGEWCRFAACKATCPRWTGPLLDLAGVDHPKVALQQSVKPNGQWGHYLASAKRLVDSALMWRKLIDEALIDHLKAGGTADGFALKPKAKDRQWLDNVEDVDLSLRELGFTDDDIWRAPQLQTFKVADAAAKRLGVKIPDELRPRPPSNEVTLTSADDPEALALPALTTEFQAALKALRG